MSQESLRSIAFEPVGFTCKDVNKCGVPANLLDSERIALPYGSYTGYAKMNVVNADSEKSIQEATILAQNNLFYWFFASQSSVLNSVDEESIPVVIWLNGGPGSSSLTGLFMENGPLQIGNDDLASIRENPFSWNKLCHMLYWDQPVGTGFSYTTNDEGYMDSESELSRELCLALDLFFQSEQFSKYRSCPLYIAGESYAGKYIPNIACELKDNTSRYPNIPPLKGVAIGDGWMLPGMQTWIQVEYGYNMGFLDTKQYQELSKKCVNLQKMIDGQEYIKANALGSEIMDELLACGGNPNIYDVRTFSPLSTNLLSAYLNNCSVKEALGTECEWQCADNGGPVGEHLAADVYAPGYQPIVELLQYAKEQDFKVLFYTGNFDMSCGFLGTERMLWNFDFPQIEQNHMSLFEPERSVTGTDTNQLTWRQLNRKVWIKIPDSTLGFVKSLGNLTQIVIVNSGHLAPMNKPKVARSMINNWIFNLPFPCQTPEVSERRS